MSERIWRTCRLLMCSRDPFSAYPTPNPFSRWCCTNQWKARSSARCQSGAWALVQFGSVQVNTPSLWRWCIPSDRWCCLQMTSRGTQTQVGSSWRSTSRNSGCHKRSHASGACQPGQPAQRCIRGIHMVSPRGRDAITLVVGGRFAM